MIRYCIYVGYSYECEWTEREEMGKMSICCSFIWKMVIHVIENRSWFLIAQLFYVAINMKIYWRKKSVSMIIMKIIVLYEVYFVCDVDFEFGKPEQTTGLRSPWSQQHCLNFFKTYSHLSGLNLFSDRNWKKTNEFIESFRSYDEQ